MKRVAVASVVLALVAVGLLAGWVWSAEEEAAAQFQQYFDKIMSELPTTLLVCSSGEVDLLV